MANVAKIIGKVAKVAKKSKKSSVKAEAAKTLKARQRVDTEAIAKRSVQIKPSSETKAKLSKARQEEYLKRSSKPKVLKTTVRKVSPKKKSGPTKSQEDEMRHSIRIEQEKIAEKQLKEHYRAMWKQWND